MADRYRPRPTRGPTLLLSLGLWTAQGAAVAVPAPRSAGAPAGAGVMLSGAWSVDEREAIDRAVDKIPRAWRAEAGALTIRRDARSCDQDGWPSDDGELIDGRIAHLCAARAGVPAEEQEEDVARQVVLALLFRFDRAAQWSEARDWRRLNRWGWSPLDGFRTRSANLDPAGFATPAGQRSPRWDLVTFLAALLLDPPGDDGGIGCRLISETNFVRRRAGVMIGPTRCAAFEDWADLDHLADVEVVLAAPSTAMIGSLFGHLFLRLVYRDPDAQDSAATPPHLSRIVAFLADNDVPFNEDPAYALKGIVGSYAASLHERSFLDAYRDYVVLEGRDLRRWRLALGAGERRALLQRIWTVAHGSRYAYYFFRRNCATLMIDLVDDIRAPDGAASPPGLLAAPPATALEPWASARATDGTALLQFVPDPISSFDHQARTAARHRIGLEPKLVAGLAVDAAAVSARAAFADVHSATPAVRAAGYDRLARALADPRAGSAGELTAWLHDGATIETQLSALANIEAEARAERQRRRQVSAATAEVAARLRADAAALRRRVGAGPATLASRLDAAVDMVGAVQPATRLAGYGVLLALARDPVTAPELAARIRLLALLRSEQRFDVARMKSVAGLRDALLFVDADQPIERQPYLAGREELLHLPCETRVSAPLLALQRAKQSLFAARDLGGAPAQDRDARATADAHEAGDASDASDAVVVVAQRDYDASLPHSGIDRFALLAGVALGRGPARGGLVVSGALYDEQLGDHHRFGFPSDTALVVARSTMFLTSDGGTRAVTAYDARLFGYRSLRVPLPESGHGRWPLGWELFSTLEGDQARALAAQAKVGWGLLAPILDRGELADHLIGCLALAYAASFPSAHAPVANRAQAISTPLALELRAGVGHRPRYRSQLAARIWIEPMALLAGGRAPLAAEAGARLEAHLALSSGTRLGTTTHAPALLLRAQVTHTTLTFTGAPTTTRALLSAGFDLR